MRRLPPLFRARFGGANVQPAIHHDRINADDFTSQGGAQAQRNFGFSAAAWTDNGDDREFHEGLILTGKAKTGSRRAPRALVSRPLQANVLDWRGRAAGRALWCRATVGAGMLVVGGRAARRALWCRAHPRPNCPFGHRLKQRHSREH